MPNTYLTASEMRIRCEELSDEYRRHYQDMQQVWVQTYANAVDRAMLDDILGESGYPWKVWTNKKPTYTEKGNVICEGL